MARRVTSPNGAPAPDGRKPAAPPPGGLNRQFYGDNLDVLRRDIADESVDLVYLDPPFNSQRTYSVLFKEKSGKGSQAQLEAFDDTWTWSHDADQLYGDLMSSPDTPNKAKDALEAMRRLLGDNDVLAYLVMMTARLIELRRVLRPTGSLYLHCDPTASHYLKMTLDAIFGAENFRNEIIWKRTSAHSSAKKYGPVHDVILYYGKSARVAWTQPRLAYEDEYLAKYYKFDDGDGRLHWRADLCAAGVRNGSSGQPWRGLDPAAKGMHWKYTTDRLEELDAEGRIYWPGRGTGWPQYKRYRSELKGRALGDIWDDIDRINPVSAERLGYPTQKPVALLERIIQASSNEGDLILDPFCGCGTTVDAAQKLGRRWIGIDVTTLAVDLIDARLRHTYGEAVRDTYEILGIPRDMGGAAALFKRSPFEFERWCVMVLDGQPNEKQVGDRGIDGVIRFPLDAKGSSDRIIVSVKGGATNPGHVRDLIGTVKSERAAMGLFVCMVKPTAGMLAAANHSGSYTHPANGQRYPKVQLVTVRELLDGKRPQMPLTMLPYFLAQRRAADSGDQLGLDALPHSA